MAKAKVKKSAAKEHDHLAMVKDQDRWPCWPYLPVKRRDKNMESKNLGILWIGTGGLIVHHTYLFGMPKTIEEFKAMPKTEYQTHEAMLADGWEVD